MLFSNIQNEVSYTFPVNLEIGAYLSCRMDKQNIQDWLTWSFSPSLSAILITLLVSLISPLLVHLYLYKSKASAVTPSFILVGPSGGGKTTLLTLVRTKLASPIATRAD